MKEILRFWPNHFHYNFSNKLSENDQIDQITCRRDQNQVFLSVLGLAMRAHSLSVSQSDTCSICRTKVWDVYCNFFSF